MTERLLTLFGFVAVVEILAGTFVAQFNAPLGGLRLLHLAEMMMLIAFAMDRFHFRDRVPRLIFAGLLLSFAGDVLIALGVPPVYAIPPSAAAHLCYVVAFAILVRNHAFDYGTPVKWSRELAPWPFLALGLWFLVIDRNAPLALLVGSLVYALMVTLMGVMAVLLGRRLKRFAMLPAVGGIVFVISDCIYGWFLLLDQTEAVIQIVWITYFLAQCLITHAAALPRRQTRFG